MYTNDINVSNRREILSHIRKIEVALGLLKHNASEKIISRSTLCKIEGYLHLAVGNIDLACGIIEGERCLGHAKKRRR